jgi:hypothetical protein
MSNAFQNVTPIDQYPASITAARPRHAFPITGNFIVFLSGGESVDVSLNDGSALFPLFVNGRYRMPPGEVFTKFELRRRATATLATNNVVMLVGVGDYDSGSVSVAADVRQQAAKSLYAYPALVLGVGVASGIFNFPVVIPRRCARIRNTGANTAVLSSTASEVIAGRGELLLPGEVLETYVDGQVYAASLVGATTLVASEELY